MTSTSTEGTLFSCSEGSGRRVRAASRTEAAAIFARRLARRHGPAAFPYTLRADCHGMDGTWTTFESTHVVPGETDGYSVVGQSRFTVSEG